MKRINILAAAILVFLLLGCAKVRVEAPKEPIKVDISMRLDIYQHVENDINDIEKIVSGASNNSMAPDKNTRSGILVGIAYAQEGLGPEVEQAAVRRRDRRQQLASWQSNGVVGENRGGLVEVRAVDKADGMVGALVREENSDRMAIYKAIAQKNSTSLEEVQKLYAKRLQNDAPRGTPIETVNGPSGQPEWNIKGGD